MLTRQSNKNQCFRHECDITKILTSTHLLCDHHHKGRKCGAADTGNSEELDEPGDIVALADNRGFDLE